MATIIFGSIAGLVGLIALKDCYKKRKNNNMPIKMAREMKQLEYVIMKKIRNIKEPLIRNSIINSEIDNYKFKTNIYQPLVECNSLSFYEDGVQYAIKSVRTDYLIERYRARNNLKMKMMNNNFYYSIAEQKLKTVMDFYNKASSYQKTHFLKNDMIAEIVYYSNYEKNLRILLARNRALANGIPHGGYAFLNYIDEVDEPIDGTI